jgi:hypothetical protein
MVLASHLRKPESQLNDTLVNPYATSRLHYANPVYLLIYVPRGEEYGEGK